MGDKDLDFLVIVTVPDGSVCNGFAFRCAIIQEMRDRNIKPNSKAFGKLLEAAAKGGLASRHGMTLPLACRREDSKLLYSGSCSRRIEGLPFKGCCGPFWLFFHPLQWLNIQQLVPICFTVCELRSNCFHHTMSLSAPCPLPFPSSPVGWSEWRQS